VPADAVNLTDQTKELFMNMNIRTNPRTIAEMQARFIRLDADSQYTIRTLRRDLKWARRLNLAFAIGALLSSAIYLNEARAGDLYQMDNFSYSQMQMERDSQERSAKSLRDDAAWQEVQDRTDAYNNSYNNSYSNSYRTKSYDELDQ
jgi:hypothetical protein